MHLNGGFKALIWQLTPSSEQSGWVQAGHPPPAAPSPSLGPRGAGAALGQSPGVAAGMRADGQQLVSQDVPGGFLVIDAEVHGVSEGGLSG